MKPVDSHCHLDFEQFDDDREEVIERCGEQLEFVVNAGSNLEHNRKALELEQQHPDTVVANLGLHPTYVDDFDQLERVMEQIRQEEPAAIGEIGLDYHHVRSPDKRERQREVFGAMLELAEEMDKPVVVHSRDAEKDAVEMLSGYSLPEVMLHCFNGEPELAVKATREGMKIGVSTQVLYSGRVKEIAGEVPLENILLETDSPFLYRGERNEPVNVKQSSESLAVIKSLPTREVVDKTTENARDVFQ